MNYVKVSEEIQKDIERWATLPLDLSSKIETIKMNVLPWLLYLFQSLPVDIPRIQFVTWDRIISRFLWEGDRPRVKYELQLPKEREGSVLTKRKEYYITAQMRFLFCWCNPNYKAKWKNIKRELNGYPIENLIGDKDQYRKMEKT